MTVEVMPRSLAGSNSGYIVTVSLSLETRPESAREREGYGTFLAVAFP